MGSFCFCFNIFRGAKLERADKDNFTPLLIAASEGHVESLKVLLKLGANVFVTDKDEKTAVFWASQENKSEAITVSVPTQHSMILPF